MRKFIFIAKQSNTKSASNYCELKFKNINPIQYKFTIYNKTKKKAHPFTETLMYDKEIQEFRKGGTIEYDLEFEDYIIEKFNHKVCGKKVGVEREKFKQYHFEQLYGKDMINTPVKEIYKLNDLWCGGTLIIFEDRSVILISHGSGMHYVSVLKGFIK